MVMMNNKASLKQLLVIFLALSFVLSSTTAVPATRLLKSDNEIPTEVQDFVAQEAMGISDSEKLVGGYIEGRMDIESQDYPGTGANNHHDPKAPGRA